MSDRAAILEIECWELRAKLNDTMQALESLARHSASDFRVDIPHESLGLLGGSLATESCCNSDIADALLELEKSGKFRVTGKIGSSRVFGYWPENDPAKAAP